MFVGSVCLPYKEETVEQRSFHSVSHFEEWLLSVTMYSEFTFGSFIKHISYLNFCWFGCFEKSFTKCHWI
jgi:hypothetical protein